MGIINWIYCEFMATFKSERYIHICQNYRFMFGLPMRWHPAYTQIMVEEELKKSKRQLKHN